MRYVFTIAFALDLFAAGIFFGEFGISVSTMAGLVRAEKDAPLKLWKWQRAFLRWLEPRLSRAHCDGAISFDRQRAQQVLDLLA